MLIKNQWYLATWSKDLAPGVLKPQTIAGERLVLFRDRAGRAHALEDRCPHRFVPLSLGRLAQDAIECAYHGLRFDCSGKCVANPHGPSIPKNASVRSFSVQEQDGGIWVYMGASPAPSACPRYEWLAADSCFVAVDQIELQANYLLAIDNILDLSHLQYLHPTTLGSVVPAPSHVDVAQDGNTIRSVRTLRGEQLSRMLEIAFQLRAGAVVDRTLDVRWTPPCTALVRMSVAPHGVDNAVRAIDSWHGFTPGTATTCHYFFAVSIPKTSSGYSQIAAQIGLRALRLPFEREDKLVLEAQQASVGEADLLALRPIVLRGDSASVRARRIVRRLATREAEVGS